jgi:hypothetical protein
MIDTVLFHQVDTTTYHVSKQTQRQNLQSHQWAEEAEAQAMSN